MQLWKSILAYDGSAFHGWQVQPGLPTVQGTLAQALHRITGESVLPQGSGRTDTGVHALAQVASFALAAPIPQPNLHRALNRALPPAIRILSIEPAPSTFHARHSAVRKTYEYRLFPRVCDPEPDRICPPMLAPYVWDFPFPFNVELAEMAAGQVVGEHDFTSFAAADPDLATRTQIGLPGERTNIRHIFSSAWHLDARLGSPHPIYVYRVTGSGFLHHMVRNLVGTFADVAASRLPPRRIPEILGRRDRSAAGPTAPARGLFLVEVEYP